MSSKKTYSNLNNYEKLEKIGKGGFSEVFKVKEKSTGNIYAAKILSKKSVENSKELLSRLSTEVGIISKLHHPSILKFIGYNPIDFEKRTRPVIITEYASNNTLEYIIHLSRHNKSLPFWNMTMKLICIYGIASGMQYLHSQNISHHDLKPGNVLMDDYLFPKIADFGLAETKKEDQELKPTKMANFTKGTPKYIAPEVWKKSQYTKAGDVYAFSIIVYEILTSLEPFKGFNNFDIFDQVVSNNYRPEFGLNSKITGPFKELIESCWSNDPEKRPTFAEIVDKLKNDNGFISKKVKTDYFYDFVRYIDEFQSNSTDLDELEIQKKKRFNSISLKDELEKLEKKKDSSYSSSSTFCSSSSSSCQVDLSDFQNFHELCEETRQFLRNSLERSNRKFKRIDIDLNDTVLLFLNGSLGSSVFINILKYFEKISFEIGYPSSLFKCILDVLTHLKQNEIPQIKINVVISLLFSIQDSAFIDCASLTEIKIPSFVSTIEKFAFSKCTSLSRIKIPSSVNYIGEFAFNECKSIRKISIPSSVSLIENSAFNKCLNLSEISIPNSITVIHHSTFNECDSLKQVSIPYSVVSIGDSAFSKCSSLIAILLPNSVVSIGNSAFIECFSLSQIIIPSSVTSIGKDVFKGCKSLKKINLSSFLPMISNSLFYGASSLNIFSIPFSVKSIGEYSFYECSSLSYFIVSASVESIGKHAFSECKSLKKIEIHSQMKLIEDHVFSGCTSLSTVITPSSLTSVGNYSFYNCSSLNEIAIPSAKSVGNYAFSGCTSLKKISLSSSVEFIGEYAFSDCSSLEQIVFPLLVKSFAKTAFNGCTYLIESTEFSSSLNVIENSLIFDCKSFKHINIDSDSIYNIYANRLLSLSSVLRIISMFKLINISIQFKMPNFRPVYQYVLDLRRNKIPQIKICIIFAGMRKIEDYFDKNDDINEIIIDNPVDSIGKDAFRDFLKLYKVSIFSPLRIIENSAFYNCPLLSDIEIPSSVISIGESVFKNCSSITQIKLPPSVTSIGWGIFIDCTGITDIVLPGSIRIIPEYAFYKCSSLFKVSIPSSVTTIGSFAFIGCCSLQQILIPASVNSIGYSAFEKSTVLKRRSKAAPRKRRIIKPIENADK